MDGLCEAYASGCGGDGDCLPGFFCAVSAATCVKLPAQEAQCRDGTRGPGETDVDCGGVCPACGVGEGCANDGDCASGVCATLRCARPGCGDGVTNGAETGTDCGGDCGACPAGQACRWDSDCQSGDCVAGRCNACGDNVRAGSEECDDGDTLAEPCAYGLTSCWVCGIDCRWARGATSYCGDGRLEPGLEVCDDGVRNRDEWAVEPGCRTDCTGAAPSCGDGAADPQEECGEPTLAACPGKYGCYLCGCVLCAPQARLLDTVFAGGNVVHVSGGEGFLYASMLLEGLTVLSTGTDLVPVGSLDTGIEPVLATALSEPGAPTALFLALGAYGLRVADLTDPAAPVLAGGLDTAGLALDVAVVSPFVLVADGSDGLRLVDPSEPANPVEVAAYTPFGAEIDRIAVSDGVAFAGVSWDSGSWVTALSVPAPGDLEVLWAFSPFLSSGGDTRCTGLAVSDGILYGAGETGVVGLAAVSSETPATFIGKLPLAGAAGPAAAHGFAWVCGTDKLVAVDPAAPGGPRVVAELALPGCLRATALGRRIYVAAGSAGVAVVEACDDDS